MRRIDAVAIGFRSGSISFDSDGASFRSDQPSFRCGGASFASDAELSDFKTQIDGYDALINRPRDLTVERKGLNDNIPGLMRELRKSIYKLDSLITLFDDTQFETDYKNARKVIDLGSRKDNTSGDTSPK